MEDGYIYLLTLECLQFLQNLSFCWTASCSTGSLAGCQILTESAAATGPAGDCCLNYTPMPWNLHNLLPDWRAGGGGTLLQHPEHRVLDAAGVGWSSYPLGGTIS